MQGREVRKYLNISIDAVGDHSYLYLNKQKESYNTKSRITGKSKARTQVLLKQTNSSSVYLQTPRAS